MSDSMSALEYENLEQKYMETKSKLKKTLQYNERYTIQIQKLNKRLKRLENENTQLEQQVNHLQTTARDTSESDVSSPANLQHERTNMVDLIHSKNQQISDLLKDIEEMENENIVLRTKLTEVKDQLAVATTEIATMTETLKTEETRVQERDAEIEKLSSEIDQFLRNSEATKSEKNVLDEKYRLMIKETEEKEIQWKTLLEEKEKQLEAIITKATPPEATLIPVKNDELLEKESQCREVETLKATLSETEAQLRLLKTEMENSTVELRESTNIIIKLKERKEQLEKKINDMKLNESEIKEQLKKSQERCQNLHKEVEYANKLTEIFETDLSTIKDQIKEADQLGVIAHLEEIQTLKIQELLHEKQIVGLVKDINKLQEMCNIFEIENISLRQQLGLRDEDVVDIDPSLLTESKKQKKLIEKLQLDSKKDKEDKVKLKLEVKDLKKQISSLMRESISRKDIPNSGLEKEQPTDRLLEERAADVKALSEENEALRKGLHEILNSVQMKNETSPRELKSDVLESLLRALDVKHISGWYHPAMRLQAELHTLEGVNIELREQLQEARSELDKLKSTPTPREDNVKKIEQGIEIIENRSSDLRPTVLSEALSNDVSCLEKIKINIMQLVIHLSETETDVNSKLESDFEHLREHMVLLHKNCINEREELLKNIKNIENNICQMEIPEIDNEMNPDKLRNMIETERRKMINSLKQINKLQEELASAKSNNSTLQQSHLLEKEVLLKKISSLRAKLNYKDKECLNVVSVKLFKEVQNSLNENLQKYRQLLTEVEEGQDKRTLEIEILKRKESDMIKENNELKENLNKALIKSIQEVYKQEPNVHSLSQKLANAEAKALSEKHRADHTNNLYELVKEQLKKSEEKFVEFSKYGDGLLQKNLMLQERIAGLEDQLTSWIDPELYKELQENFNSLIKEKDLLLKENADLAKKCHEVDNSLKSLTTWSKEKEQELLGLKHEIIDLTAISDDKSMIDQLYGELSKSRSDLRDHQIQVEFLRREILNFESRYGKLCSEMEVQRSHFEVERKVLDKKIGILQDVLLKQRIQYHGCVPLIIQELFVEKLQTIHKEKHDAFIILQNAAALGVEAGEIKKGMADQDYDSKNQQIQYLKQKVYNQEKSLEKLEKELFSAYKLMEFNKPVKDVSAIRKRTPILVRELVSLESLDPVTTIHDARNERASETRIEARIVILRNIESQTDQPDYGKDEQLTMANVQLNSLQNQLSIKNNHIAERERFLLEKDKELDDAREQQRRFKEQVVALENTLKDMQDREKIQAQLHYNGGAGDGAGLKTDFLNEQVLSLRGSLKTALDRIKQKDLDIIKYQTLLKEDRDKHSLAAANLQQELNVLRKSLLAEQQSAKSLQQELAVSRQKSVAVEKYVTQVRALEKHLAELHTRLAQVQAQLQNAHQEATRWRQMAQDRLVAMQELGKSLNEQHDKELISYKTDYEKLKELSEEGTVAAAAAAETKPAGFIDPEILKLCRDKDDKIEELMAKLKELESGETTEKRISSAKDNKSNREQENLRSKYEIITQRERSLKEEIRDLKEQLSKRSNLSARSQKSERSVKEQLQKRINFLEKDIDDLNDKLLQQQLLNEKHKMCANEDFEKWKKQKYWQENCEKYKNKLREKEEEAEKFKQACTGYRMLIERLEREKINLENRLKTLKLDQRNSIVDQERAVLKDENDRLTCELAMLQAKMEMRQQGAGALGAALMQEKLEAQERKIAVLELSAKGTVEVRNELERLQTSLANLQKTNLCLEAENLELKMDLEKYIKETPHLQEQIQHLESYIELLKEENQKQSSNPLDVPRTSDSSEDKKLPQLERTVFVLKRVVQKLQVENKRLVSGKRPISERSPSADKLRRDYLRLKEQHTESLQKIKDLETQLQLVKKVQRNTQFNEKTDDLRSQLSEVREQLNQKTQLLNKVKALLHTAAAREKQLLKELAELKSETNVEKEYQVDIPSTIEEVSEVSSDG